MGDGWRFFFFFFTLNPIIRQMRLKVHSFGMLHLSAQTIKNSCFSSALPKTSAELLNNTAKNCLMHNVNIANNVNVKPCFLMFRLILYFFLTDFILAGIKKCIPPLSMPLDQFSKHSTSQAFCTCRDLRWLLCVVSTQPIPSWVAAADDLISHYH